MQINQYRIPLAYQSNRPSAPREDEPLGMDAAIAEISKAKGTLYDQDITDACCKIFRDNKFKFE